MKLSCQDRLAKGNTLSEKLTFLEKAGFDAVEFEGWGLIDRAPEIAKAMKDSKLKVSTICGAPSKGCLLDADPAVRKEALDNFKATIDAAQKIGAQGLITVPIFNQPRVNDLSPVMGVRQIEDELMVAALKEVAGRAEAAGLKIYIEPLNRYETHYLNRLEQGVELARRLAHPAVCIMADLFHMNIEEADMPKALAACGKFIGHVHLADSNRHYPGLGHTDFRSCFRALKKEGFDRYMAYETAGDPHVEVELPKSVAFVKKEIAAA